MDQYETVKLERTFWRGMLDMIRDRPFETLGGVLVGIWLVALVIQELLAPALAAVWPPPRTAILPPPTLGLPVDSTYPHAFERAVSVYNEPLLTTYRGPVEVGRRFAVIGQSGNDWYFLRIAGTGEGWVPREFLPALVLARLPINMATPVVIERTIQVVVTPTAIPLPPVVPVHAPPPPVVPSVPTVVPAPLAPQAAREGDQLEPAPAPVPATQSTISVAPAEAVGVSKFMPR